MTYKEQLERLIENISQNLKEYIEAHKTTTDLTGIAILGEKLYCLTVRDVLTAERWYKDEKE